MPLSCQADSSRPGPGCDNLGSAAEVDGGRSSGADTSVEEDTMGKTGRKRRARKKKGANHGKRPNA